MRVLIIKTSSLGDIIHTLPALTDAGKAIPTIEFDWVIERPFSQIPGLHPLVKNIIPVELRRWRKHPIKAFKSGEWQTFYQAMRAKRYDLVIDAQGLVKSAFLTRLAKGIRAGLDFRSAWEPFASLFYQRRFTVNPQQHAVTRVRQLFAAALDYPVPTTMADYGLDRNRLPTPVEAYPRYTVFLHGTTWPTKHWPEVYWQQLARMAVDAGLHVLLPWGNEAERQRAEKIAQQSPLIRVLPRMALQQIAGIIAQAKAVVTVDTGLGHLAAALAVPTLSLYGPTDPVLTGTVGENQIHLAAQFACAPCLKRECTYKGATSVQPACFTSLSPERVWQELKTLMSSYDSD